MNKNNKKILHLITLVFLSVGVFFVIAYVHTNHMNLISKNIFFEKVFATDYFAFDNQKLNNRLFSSLQERIRSQDALSGRIQELQEQLAISGNTSELGENPLAEPAVHILLVAGHTEKTKGAVFQDTTEYELNYELLGIAAAHLKERGYRVTVSHEGGDYTEQFLSYFEDHEERILAYREERKAYYDELYPQGVVTNDTDHNYASALGVVQLYGVNLWVNEHDVDAAIHIHFNDYPGRESGKVGTHTGFSIFVPLKTNNHFVSSFELAKEIEVKLLGHSERSTVLQESAGILESELIAVGQANSVTIPSVLVENGFIYEDQFQDPLQRHEVLDKYAASIVSGIDSYFKK